MNPVHTRSRNPENCTRPFTHPMGAGSFPGERYVSPVGKRLRFRSRDSLGTHPEIWGSRIWWTSRCPLPAKGSKSSGRTVKIPCSPPPGINFERPARGAHRLLPNVLPASLHLPWPVRPRTGYCSGSTSTPATSSAREASVATERRSTPPSRLYRRRVRPRSACGQATRPRRHAGPGARLFEVISRK